MHKSDEEGAVDRLFRNAQKAGLGARQQGQDQAQAPQPAQPKAPAPQEPQPASPAKRTPRKVFRATRTVFRGVGGIWRLLLTLLDLAIVVAVAGLIVIVLHALTTSNTLQVPASVGRLIDTLYRLVIQASGAILRHLTK